MKTCWTGRSIVSGNATGEALISGVAFSFLGDVDITTGKVVGEMSDILGQALTGKVLVVPGTRGSAGAWRFLYQLKVHGTHPAALITADVPDPSVVQGAILAGIPVVSGLNGVFRDSIEKGRPLEVDGPLVRCEMDQAK